MKRLLKPLLYLTAVVLLSVSCGKKDPSACGPDNKHFRYIKTIKNVKADWGLSDYFVTESGEGWLICPFQKEQFASYENTYVLGKPQPFKYRIWGRFLNCDACPVIAAGPVLHIVIDKIEKVN